MKRAALVSAVLLLVATGAAAETVRTPEAGTYQAKLLDGIKAIQAGQFDDFITKHCSNTKLCVSAPAKTTVKQRLAVIKPMNCLKAQASIVIKSTESISESEKKLFVQCEETAMPIPFRMVLENGHWYFASL